MSVANELEQQMLQLINSERAAAGLSPLAFNDMLNDASEDHSQWMLDTDTFSHVGKDNSSAQDRMEDAGYQFEGNWNSGENIAFQSERGAPGLADDVVDLHEGLMNSPGHRANILNPNFDEIGIGIERGDFGTGSVFDSVMVTQNFAASDAINSPVPAPDSPAPGDELPDDDEVAEMPDDSSEAPQDDDVVDSAEPEEDDTDTPDDTVDFAETDEADDDSGKAPDEGDGSDEIDGEEDPVDIAETDDPEDDGEDIPDDDGTDVVDTGEADDDEEDTVDVAETDDPEDGDEDMPGEDDGTDVVDTEEPADDDLMIADGCGFDLADLDMDLWPGDAVGDQGDDGLDLDLDDTEDAAPADEGQDWAASCDFDLDAFLAHIAEFFGDGHTSGADCQEIA